MAKKPKKKQPPARYYVLFNKYGELFSFHTSAKEAHEDAVGPAFRKKAKPGTVCNLCRSIHKGMVGSEMVLSHSVCDYTVRQYDLVLRKYEERGVAADI